MSKQEMTLLALTLVLCFASAITRDQGHHFMGVVLIILVLVFSVFLGFRFGRDSE